MRDSDERAAQRIVSLYEEKALAWVKSRKRNPTLEQHWLERFEIGLQALSKILDFGAGNGYPVAAALLNRGHKIIGVDSAASLIRAARTSLPDAEWHVADMRRYGDELLFDGVIAWHSFFHLTQSDQRSILPRFTQFLRPGGRLLFTSGPGPGVTIGDWEGEPLFHASLSQEEYKSLLHEGGFDHIETKARDPDTWGATVWLAQCR